MNKYIKELIENNLHLLNRIGNPDDEFYTLYSNIEKELTHYDLHNKIVYCNCDNPSFSNIYKCLKTNFHKYGLKLLYSSFYSEAEQPYITLFDGKNIKLKYINNGSFNSDECILILDKCDIVISNPPFGKLCLEFVKLMFEHNKDFICCYPILSLKNKFLINLFINKQLFSGYTYINNFNRPDKSLKSASVVWITTINNNNKDDIFTDNNELKNIYKVDGKENVYGVTDCKYIPNETFKYNLMVPISYIRYYNPEEFDIIKLHRNIKYIGIDKIFDNRLEIKRNH